MLVDLLFKLHYYFLRWIPVINGIAFVAINLYYQVLYSKCGASRAHWRHVKVNNNLRQLSCPY